MLLCGYEAVVGGGMYHHVVLLGAVSLDNPWMSCPCRLHRKCTVPAYVPILLEPALAVRMEVRLGPVLSIAFEQTQAGFFLFICQLSLGAGYVSLCVTVLQGC